MLLMNRLPTFLVALFVPAVLGASYLDAPGEYPRLHVDAPSLIQNSTLVPESPLPDDVAITSIRTLADSAPLGNQLELEDLITISQSARVMQSGWNGRAPRRPVDDWALTRILKTLEWAIRQGDGAIVKSLASDMRAKADDCRISPSGRFGDVTVAIRTVLPDGTEQQGLRVRYIERFYFDLLKKVPALASRWQEFPTVSAIAGAPLTAGDWMIVARAPDGREISDAKPISVGGKRPAKFDLLVR
jgi:hypothetical protein